LTGADGPYLRPTCAGVPWEGLREEAPSFGWSCGASAIPFCSEEEAYETSHRPTPSRVALAGLLAGCAPTAALQGARDAYATAKAAGAKDKAPYEYYAANIYLNLADVVNKEKAYPQAKAYALKSRSSPNRPSKKPAEV